MTVRQPPEGGLEAATRSEPASRRGAGGQGRALRAEVRSLLGPGGGGAGGRGRREARLRGQGEGLPQASAWGLRQAGPGLAAVTAAPGRTPGCVRRDEGSPRPTASSSPSRGGGRAEARASGRAPGARRTRRAAGVRHRAAAHSVTPPCGAAGPAVLAAWRGAGRVNGTGWAPRTFAFCSPEAGRSFTAGPPIPAPTSDPLRPQTGFRPRPARAPLGRARSRLE